MNVTIQHIFDIPPADYATLYFEEPFAIALSQSAGIGRTLLRLDREPGRVVRHILCEAGRDVPAAIARLIEGGGFNYVEVIDFDLRALRGRWRVIPSIFAERVRASGTLDFEDADGKVSRVVRGEVSVSIPAIGGLVERFVVAEVEKAYAAASAFTRSYLEQRRG